MKFKYDKEFGFLIIENSWIPFKGYELFNFLGFIIFKRKGTITSIYELNHEKIHSKQIFELLIIGFYLLYILNWILVGFNYDKVCFEKEAYNNDSNLDYLKKRKFL